MLRIIKLGLISIIALISLSCKLQNNNWSLGVQERTPKILCTEALTNSIYGNLVIYDINTGDKKLLKSHFPIGSQPKMTGDGKYLIYFQGSYSAFLPKFIISDLSNNADKFVDLTARLPVREKFMDLLLCFQIFNDSTIVFNYKNSLYSYNFISDLLKEISIFKDVKIWEIQIYNQESKMAFRYQENFDVIDIPKLAIFDYIKGNIKCYQQTATVLSNWSQDGTKLILFDINGNEKLYESVTDSFLPLDKIEYHNMKFVIKYFISEDQIILKEYEPNQNLILYDLKNKRVIRQLTDDNLERQGIDISIIKN